MNSEKMKLKKLSISRFNIEKSIWYNRIYLTKVFDELSYAKINKNVKILGYQKSDAIGYYKEDREYVLLFEFKDEPENEYWCHINKNFCRLNKDFEIEEIDETN